MEKIDKWCAEQCGVAIIDGGGWVEPFLAGTVLSDWTIQDPRCREIVREHFRISTNIYYEEKGWLSSTVRDRGVFGKTIAEAECKCITAIYEAEHEN